MALRRFVDADGRAWEAWHVRPLQAHTPVRSGEDRRARPGDQFHPDRRGGPDRRTQPFNPALAYGWVVFETPGEKRRLVPAPPEWDDCPDTALEQFWRRAQPLGPPSE